MPLLKHIHPFKGTQLAIWQITESAEELMETFVLTDEEQNEVEAIKSQKTRLQWIASRRLVRLLCGCSLLKDQYGKPRLANGGGHISISHTEGFAAVIISDKHVGIDINMLDKNIENIAHKFINAKEAKCLANGSEKSTQIHLFWAAKEAMYKLYGKKEVAFLKDLIIEPFQLFEKGTLKSRIVKKDFPSGNLDLHYFFERGYVVAYCLNPIEKDY